MPGQPDTNETIFVSFNALLNTNATNVFHNVNTHRLTYLYDDGFSISMKTNLEHIARNEDNTSCVARYQNMIGMAYFTQQDFFYNVIDESYLEDDDKWIAPLSDNECYFFSFASLVRMSEWNNERDFIVPLKNVTLYKHTTHTEMKNLTKSALKADALKSSQKKVRIDHTPADSLSRHFSVNSDGITTGGTSYSASSNGTSLAEDDEENEGDQMEEEEDTMLQTSWHNKENAINKKEKIGMVNRKDKSSVKEKTRKHSTSTVTDLTSQVKAKQRVAGPSDKQACIDKLLENDTSSRSNRGGRSRGDNASGADEIEMNRQFSAQWKGMVGCSGWAMVWGKAKIDFNNIPMPDYEFYFTPLSSGIISESIENLEFFYTKDAMKAHLISNPCLTFEWVKLWPMLNRQGWERVYQSTKKGSSASSLEFSRLPSSTKREAGLHKFASKLALLKYISRFPYPLQTDEVFKATLEAHGWTCLRNGNFTDDLKKNKAGYAIQEVRDRLWENPTVLFVNSEGVTSERLMEAIKLERSSALQVDVEADSPGHLNNSDVTMTLDEFLNGRGDIKTSKDKELFTTLLQREQWKTYAGGCYAGQWYKHEFMWVAPWYNSHAKPEPGIDCFWVLSDVFNFLKTRGNHEYPRSREPIELKVDYRSPKWSLNKRIKQLAIESKDARAAFQANLLSMLITSGWKKLDTPTQWPKSNGSIENSIFVPRWNEKVISHENLSDYEMNLDYFCDKDELLTYLQTKGNNGTKVKAIVIKENDEWDMEEGDFGEDGFRSKRKRRDAVAESPCHSDVSDEEFSMAFSPPKDPALKLIYYIHDEVDTNSFKESTAQVSHFAEIWSILKSEYGWENLTNKQSGTYVFVAPWAMGNRDKTGHGIDLTGYHLHRDYFDEKGEVLEYLKRFGPFKTDKGPSPMKGRVARRSSTSAAEEASEVEAAAEKYVYYNENLAVLIAQQQKILAEEKKKRRKTEYESVGVSNGDQIDDDECAIMYDDHDLTEAGQETDKKEADDEDRFQDSEEDLAEYESLEEIEKEARQEGTSQILDDFRPGKRFISKF